MAGNTSTHRRGRRRLGLGAAFAAALAVATAPYYAGCLKGGDFRLAGDITAPPHLHRKVSMPNTMLFIVAVNGGGVPVAVKRVVNPQLPLSYKLGPEDLVFQGPSWKGPLAVRVHVNDHGSVGLMLRGDLVGSHPTSVQSGDSGVHVVVDGEVTGDPRGSVRRLGGPARTG